MSVGTQIAGYRVDEQVGSGGMGVVYRAHDLALERPVALKLLSPALAEDRDFRERFLVESRLAAALEHPNVIPVHDAGEADGQLYLAMRYVEGSDLKELLRSEGTLEPAQAIAICSQVAAALDAAHARGLVHRDVKPSNVLLDEHEHVYLADFGLTRRLAEQAPGFEAGLSLGTPSYVAPEQIEGKELDGRADQYSLACVLTECLTGEPPFPRGSEAATLFAHLEEAPPSPERLEQVMPKALAKDPADRYASCAELIAAARHALGLEPKRARWPLALAGLGAALIGAATLAFFLTRVEGGPQAEPGADSLVRIDPKTNKVSDTMPVGRTASGVAAAGRYVWVTSFADGTLWRIDPKTNASLKIQVGGSPTGVAALPGAVLVANSSERSLVQVNAADTSAQVRTQLAGDASGNVPVAAGAGGGGAGSVWFADAAGRMVATPVAVARGGGEPFLTTRIPVDERSFRTAYQAFGGLAADDLAIWVTGDPFARKVWKLHPTAHRVVASISLPFAPYHVATGRDAVWVTSLLDGRIARIDPFTNRITAVFRVGRDVSAIVASEGSLWVASAIDKTVSRLDPHSGRVVARVRTVEPPTHISAGAGGVWVTTARPTPPVPPGSIGIGVIAECRGPFGTSYGGSVAGTELVLLHHGGRRAGPTVTDGVTGARIAGRQVTLALGCSDGTATSFLAEARRLVEQVGVHVLIGPTSSRPEEALQEYARAHPTVAFINGVAAAQIMHPAPNFFSFRRDGATWMAGLGTYAYGTLRWRRAVTVADLDDDTFNWAQTAGFIAEFCSLGGTIAKRVWVSPGTRDYSAVVAQIPTRGVDGIVAATGLDTAVALARTYSGLRRGKLGRKLLLGANVQGGPGYQSLWRRYAGFRSFAPEGQADPADMYWYLADFHKHFPAIPANWSGYYEAMTATVKALEAVHGDLSGGESRLQVALAGVRLASPGGPIRLDASRQAVGSNRVWTLAGSFVYRRVEHTFGGYFKPGDPPPSRTSPACKKGNLPPWARK